MLRSMLVVAVMCSAAPSLWAQDAKKQDPFEFAVGEGKIKFYGFVRLDIQYDDSKANDPQVIQWIRSEDNTQPLSANSAHKGDAQLQMHPKLTRFGIDVTGVPIEKLGNAKATAKIEVDFYGTASSESREGLRMRHAYGKLAWDEMSLLFGQTADVISPIFPVVNADMVMWNAGNLGDRRPQLRFEYSPKMDAGKLTIQVMLGLTGADDNVTLDPATGTTNVGNLDGVDAATPTIQARVGYNGDHFWMPGKKWEAGVWIHTAKEELAEGAAPINGQESFTSSAFGIDLTLPLMDGLDLTLEYFSGKNLDDVRGGIGQGVNAATGEEIKSTGGWLQLGYLVTEVYTIYVGITLDNPEKGLPTTGAREKNSVTFIGNRFKVSPTTVFGVDILLWKTEWSSPMEDGTDTRLNLFAQWNF